jgi:hypothetical protein
MILVEPQGGDEDAADSGEVEGALVMADACAHLATSPRRAASTIAAAGSASNDGRSASL